MRPSDRSALVRLAASLVKGSPERGAIVAGLAREARADYAVISKYSDGSFDIALPGGGYAVLGAPNRKTAQGWSVTIYDARGREVEHLGKGFKSSADAVAATRAFKPRSASLNHRVSRNSAEDLAVTGRSPPPRQDDQGHPGAGRGPVGKGPSDGPG